jgi:type II secretory pathway component PulM
MTTINPKQKIYLTAGCFLIVVVLIVVFGVLPLISKIKKEGKVLISKKQMMEFFYDDWRTLENAKKEYQKIQKEMDSLSALLPLNETIKFIMSLENIAQITNNQEEISVLNYGSQSVAESQKKQPQKDSLSFQVKLQGSFPNLIKFLTYLENNSYYNDVNSIQIQRFSQKELSNIGDISTVLKLSVYQQ